MIPFDKDELHHTTANKKREKSIPTPFTKRRKKKKKTQSWGQGQEKQCKCTKTIWYNWGAKKFPTKETKCFAPYLA